MGVPGKPTRLPRDSFKSRMDFSSLVQNYNYEQEYNQGYSYTLDLEDAAATWDLVSDIWK